MDLLRWLVEVLEQCRAQPTDHVEFVAPVDIASALLVQPLQRHLVPREGKLGEDQDETVASVGNLLGETIDDQICTGHERFLDQTDCGVVEDPHPFMGIRVDHLDTVIARHEMPLSRKPLPDSKVLPETGAKEMKWKTAGRFGPVNRASGSPPMNQGDNFYTQGVRDVDTIISTPNRWGPSL